MQRSKSIEKALSHLSATVELESGIRKAIIFDGEDPELCSVRM